MGLDKASWGRLGNLSWRDLESDKLWENFSLFRIRVLLLIIIIIIINDDNDNVMIANIGTKHCQVLYLHSLIQSS